MRKDPRQQQILRNRLHPLHAQLIQALSPVKGLRRNPRAAAFTGPNGIKRIDRSRIPDSGLMPQSRMTVHHSAAEPELPFFRIENPEKFILVVAELSGGRLTLHDRDNLALARKMADNGEKDIAVALLVMGPLKEDSLDNAGADRLIHLPEAPWDDYQPELKASGLQSLDRQLNPLCWLFPDSRSEAAELALRLATRLEQRVVRGLWQTEGEQLRCRAAGNHEDILRPAAESRIWMTLENCAQAAFDFRYEAIPLSLKPEPGVFQRIRNLGLRPVDPAGVALAEAEFILSAGNGIHDWEQFHRLAAMLGASEGASRVAVDNGNMPRSRQVGATGTFVSARVYVAAGISGAVQHMQGLAKVDKVIAINTDAGCDMVRRADLALIADSHELFTELLRQLAERNGMEVDDVA